MTSKEPLRVRCLDWNVDGRRMLSWRQSGEGPKPWEMALASFGAGIVLVFGLYALFRLFRRCRSQPPAFMKKRGRGQNQELPANTTDSISAYSDISNKERKSAISFSSLDDQDFDVEGLWDYSVRSFATTGGDSSVGNMTTTSCDEFITTHQQPSSSTNVSPHLPQVAPKSSSLLGGGDESVESSEDASRHSDDQPTTTIVAHPKRSGRTDRYLDRRGLCEV